MCFCEITFLLGPGFLLKSCNPNDLILQKFHPVVSLRCETSQAFQQTVRILHLPTWQKRIEWLRDLDLGIPFKEKKLSLKPDSLFIPIQVICIPQLGKQVHPDSYKKWGGGSGKGWEVGHDCFKFGPYFLEEVVDTDVFLRTKSKLEISPESPFIMVRSGEVLIDVPHTVCVYIRRPLCLAWGGGVREEQSQRGFRLGFRWCSAFSHPQPTTSCFCLSTFGCSYTCYGPLTCLDLCTVYFNGFEAAVSAPWGTVANARFLARI